MTTKAKRLWAAYWVLAVGWLIFITWMLAIHEHPRRSDYPIVVAWFALPFLLAANVHFFITPASRTGWGRLFLVVWVVFVTFMPGITGCPRHGWGDWRVEDLPGVFLYPLVLPGVVLMTARWVTRGFQAQKATVRS